MYKFMVNFIESFIGYIIINLIGYLIRSAFYPEMGIWNYIDIMNTPTWVAAGIFIIGVALNVAITTMLYFVLGRKLKLLNNQLINYLSVSSSFIFVSVIVFAHLAFPKSNTQLLFDANASFGMVWGFVVTFWKNNISYYVMAIIPSIIMWLGMLYQSKNLKQ